MKGVFILLLIKLSALAGGTLWRWHEYLRLKDVRHFLIHVAAVKGLSKAL